MEGLKKLKSKVIKTISCAFSDYSKEEAIRKASSVTITYCRRIGKYEVNKTRPIAITFLNHEDQEYFLQMEKSLHTGIYIDEEYPSEVGKIRSKLYPTFKYATQLDSYKGKCKFLYDSILIDVIKYGITDLLKLPDEINPLKTSQKIMIKPWSSQPLYQFSLLQIFTSSGQYIQYKRACLFNDLNTASEIWRTEIPLEANCLGKKVKDFNLHQWKEEGLEVIETGITAKFLQNENLHRCLLATSNKLLAEASMDTLWGIGLQLHHRDILNRFK